MATLSGLHAKTGEYLQLDAGILCTGVQQSSIETGSPDWVSIVKTGILGATKGGTTFTATPEFRSLLDGVNGSRGNYKNGQVIDSWDISFKTTISEMTAENIRLAMGTGESSTEKAVGGSKLNKTTPNVGLVKKESYLSSLVWIGTMSKEGGEPMIIYLKDVLNVNGVNFTSSDKETGAVELELKAHFDISKPEEVPFFIYTPKGGDS